MVLGNCVENVASIEASDNTPLVKYAYQNDKMLCQHEFGSVKIINMNAFSI